MFEDYVNPFAVRFVRPGAIPFIFPPGDSAAAVVARFEAQGRRGEIIGPHGSGKSSLLAELVAEFRRQEKQVCCVGLHAGDRWPSGMIDAIGEQDTVIAIDGAEQLSWWQRRRLFARVQRIGCGLIVTAHRSLGLPLLAKLQPTLDVALAIVARLQSDAPLLSEDEVAEAFLMHRGDFREMLFDLYDRYAQRRLR